MAGEILKLSESEAGGLVGNLRWLADAPLFIDKDQIERFYDAVVRPKHSTGETKLTLTAEKAKELQGTLGVEVTPSSLLTALGTFLPFVPSMELSAEGTVSSTTTDSKTVEIVINEIHTPQRQLEQLVLHYLVNLPSRIFVRDKPSTARWRDAHIIAPAPRAMAFLDLPGRWDAEKGGLPTTKLIPTAAEFANGQVELLYTQLRGNKGEDPPRAPEPGANRDETNAKWREYWKWYDEHFDATRAIIAIEKAATKHGRINWIDYRLPLNKDGETLHLHVCPNGNFDAGVLAYNFVKRGYSQGIRIIGTLKSGPDMNVLAIYDK
jgi:hypothetical protein